MQLLLAAKANTEAQNEVGRWGMVKQNSHMHSYCPGAFLCQLYSLSGPWARDPAAIRNNYQAAAG